MICYLKGKILKQKNGVINLITENNIGFRINISGSFFLSLRNEENIEVFTYMKVTENSIDLFGFRNLIEKNFFELLISVNGVGPKSALNILDLGSIEEIEKAIANADVNYLIKVNGIGRKSAERIVVELKNKVAKYDLKTNGEELVGDKLEEVIDALISMGYKKEDILLVIKKIDIENKNSEGILREVLKYLAKV
ncbi:MAG: Holliday junction branch migration protein RuvA [Patescibacteria group bacterium]